VEKSLEGFIRQKGTEKGTIVTIGRGTTESNNNHQIKLERWDTPRPRWLLDHCLLKGLVTGNNLH
jgi:hypothetical protein